MIVVLLQPVFDIGFFSKSDDKDITLVIPGFDLVLDDLEVQDRKGVFERDDPNEFIATSAIKEGVGFVFFDTDMFNGEFGGFVVLDLKIIVVDAVNREGQGCWGGVFLPLFKLQLALLDLFLFDDLLVNDGLEALGRGLDGTFVDVGGDPSPAQFLGDSSGGTRADETI